MAWPGSSKVLTYTVLASFNKLTGAMDMDADTFKIALYGNGTPVNTGTTLASTEYGATWNTCTEATASGYTAGGVALTAPTSVQSGNQWIFACTTAASWTVTSALSAYGALIYDNTVSGNPGLGFLDFLGVQTVSTGAFNVAFAPNIYVLTAS